MASAAQPTPRRNRMIKTPHLDLLVQYLTPVFYTVLFYFIQIEPKDGSYLMVLLLLGGFYIGNALLWLDGKVLYGYYNELKTLPKQLITRSVLFVLAYLALAIFMVTSSNNLIGVGIVLAIGLTIATEMLATRKDLERFHQQFLFQVKRRLSPLEITRITYGFSSFVTLMAFYFLVSASR